MIQHHTPVRRHFRIWAPLLVLTVTVLAGCGEDPDQEAENSFTLREVAGFFALICAIVVIAGIIFACFAMVRDVRNEARQPDAQLNTEPRKKVPD